MDKTSGACQEVPRPLNSEYYADERGYWSTDNRFKYEKAIYHVSAKSLQFIDSDYRKAMVSMINQLTMMTDKGKLRDFSWNMVMWGSFSATVIAPDYTDEITGKKNPGGSLTMYAEADSDIIFGARDIISVNFGNKNGICAPLGKTSGYFDSGSKSFVFKFKVCEDGSCDYLDSDYCVDSTDPTSIKKKDIFYPSQFGYIFGKTESSDIEVKVDSRTLTTGITTIVIISIITIITTTAITTTMTTIIIITIIYLLALAVNLGMITVSDLQEIGKDDELEAFKKQLVAKKVLSAKAAQNLRAFYDYLVKLLLLLLLLL